MDIAKIRKKIKETKADNQQYRVDNQTPEEPEATTVKPEEKPSEPIKFETDIAPKEELIRDNKISVKEERTRPRGIEEKIEGYATDEVIEILTFSLLKEEFAFKVSQLKEILRPQRITRVPKMPNYILGITSLRGKIIPVIDLKTKLSLKDKPTDIDHRGKILIIKGPKGPIGVAVDKVTGVVRIAKSEILPPPSHLTESELTFIEGVAVIDKRFISIIHMEEATKI